MQNNKAKKICMFQVSALKKLGMVGQHYILFIEIFYIDIAFLQYFSSFSSIFENILITSHNKMFRVMAKT